MKILLKNAEVLWHGDVDILVEGEFIKEIAPHGTIAADNDCRVIDCRGKMLMPGLYNCHSHAAMTLFRGYGEDMPLDKWLFDKIFPAEALLTNESVYVASVFACAEMIRAGIVSFTDMYEKCDQTARAVAETGIKANISRAVLSFDPEEKGSENSRLIEAKTLFRDFHNSSNGRVKIDMSVHAEYTNTENSFRATAEAAKELGANMHVHLSETASEHEECKGRRGGRTPAEFMRDCGIFDVPTTAAHCVFVSDGDLEIMREYGVTAAHNPSSNLKLGSGIMRTSDFISHGVNVTLGTDGCASNNRLDVFKEAYLASILDKGITNNPGGHMASEFLKMATENGALSQGRSDCGAIACGKKADIIAVDLDELHNIPKYDLSYAALYSVTASDVTMTMCDGKILYENGEFTTIDIEKLKYDMRNTCGNYFKKA